MKYKIGIFGSAVDEGDKVVAKAQELGKELGRYKNSVTIVTGACTGMPYTVAYEAAQRGVEVWGYSPVKNLKEQKEFTPSDDLSIYTKIIYVSGSFEYADNPDVCKKYRNVISTANCDAAIIISGRWGTMNEFTNLHDFGKVIGVLTGTGGMADELPSLTEKIKKKSKARVLFENSPEILVKNILKTLRSS